MPISEKESYDNTLFYFRKTLGLLAADAATQSAILRRSPNAAWELSRDVIDLGRNLLFVSRGRLSDQQKLETEALIAETERFPTALKSVSSSADNLRAMEDRFWIPLRAAAVRLLATLPYIDETSSFG